jgi:outer membrane protein assembly factor BamB
MKHSLAAIAIPIAAAALGVALLAVWTTRGTVGGLTLAARVPGMDRPDEPDGRLSGSAEARPSAGNPVRSDVKPSTLSGAWPCFRGPDHDGICKDGVRLAKTWPDGGPPVLWQVELGPGHAGAAVARGRIFVLDYDVAAQADTMRCLSPDDGREIWRNSYPVVVPENHGMSRTVPAVYEDCVVSLGPKCHVACWDLETGQCRWLIDLVAEYGSKVPAWYAGQCPLVDGGRVILAPAGSSLLIAVDCKTGRIVWRSPRVGTWAMTHVSIAPMEHRGKRMYVYCGSGGVAGISAEDGALLWQSTAWKGKMATCPTAIPVGEGRVFVCGGYEAGSAMLQLEEQGGQLAARCAYRLSARQFGSEQHTPIFYNGHLYAVRTKPGTERLVCLDLEGRELWNSGKDKFGRGPYLVADGRIYVLSDTGLLAMVAATPAAYRPMGRFQVLDGANDAWAPMALADGRLILRDLTRMVCIDVSEK